MSLPQVSQPGEDHCELAAKVVTQPQDKDAIFRLAQSQVESGQFAEAAALYRQLIAQEPENGQAWVSLGHCYYLKGDYESCFSTFQKALSCKIEGDSEPRLWYGIGRLSAKMKDYDNAIRVLKIVFEVAPSFKERGEVYLTLAETYRAIANYEEAINNFTSSLPHLPLRKQAKVYCDIGVCQQVSGSVQDALTCFRKAAEIDPIAVRPLLHLAWALAGEKDAALLQLQRAAEVARPDTKELSTVRYLCGRVLEAHGLLEESWREFRAVEEVGEDPLFLCSAGVVLSQQKDADGALARMQRAVKVANFPILHYNLGVAYELANRLPEAMQAYQKAVESEQITFPQALSRLRELKDRTGSPPPMVHPPFEITDALLQIRANPPFPAPVKVAPPKAKAPIFKVTKVDPPPKPAQTVKRRPKAEVQPVPVPPHVDMYPPMIPFYCMPPGTEMEKQQMATFFPGQVMYYPFMPYFVPPQEAAVSAPPADEGAKQVPADAPLSEPSDIASSSGEQTRDKAELEELISDCSDSADSIDGMRIKRRRTSESSSRN